MLVLRSIFAGVTISALAVCTVSALGIRDITGTKHASPLNNYCVIAGDDLTGVVTKTIDTYFTRGFFIQTTDGGDGDDRTAEGLFVYRGFSLSMPSVGRNVRVTGRV